MQRASNPGAGRARKFDAIVVGAGGAGMRASLQLAEAGLKVAVLSKVFPTRSHTVAAQGGIGACAGQHERGQLALAHVRHGQGLRLSRRPGRDRVHVPRGAGSRLRTGAFRHAVRPQRRRHDLPAAVRRAHSANFGEKPVQRACAAADRTGHAMLHTLYQRNVQANTHFFVEWMALDLIRDADGDVLGVTAMEMETGEVMVLQARATLLATGGAGRIFAASTNAFINTGDGLGMAARAGHSAGGHGVLAVPSHRRGRRRRADHRGRARRGRHPAQQRRRALHGALCAQPQGPGQPRRGLARHGPGDQGRPRLRPAQGLRAAQAGSPRAGGDHRSACRHPRDRHQVCQRRSGPGTDPGGADGPLHDGRHPDQLSRPGGGALRTATRKKSCRDFMRWANAPACRCMARTGWAATRCSTCWCSAGRRAMPSSRRASTAIAHKPLPADAADSSLARLARLEAATVGRTASPRSRTELRRAMQAHCGVFRYPRAAARGRGEDPGDRTSASSGWRSRTRARCSIPRASRRWNSTT